MPEDLLKSKVIIIDFGSQYTQLIARRVRELNVYSEIYSCHTDPASILKERPGGIILSGGPGSIYARGPGITPSLFSSGIPLLGICYGMQLIAQGLKGRVQATKNREYGRTEIAVKRSPLFSGLPHRFIVWMSHGDSVTKLPTGFRILASSRSVPIAAIGSGKIFGLQFHPEVSHTQFGKKILKNFLFRVCRLEPSWSLSRFVESVVTEIRDKVKDRNVICGLSGGVDSATAATIVGSAVGKKLHTIFVDNGLLRRGEVNEVKRVFRRKYNFHFVDARRMFLRRLKDITDPEKKRRVIGETFIEVFEREAKRVRGVEYLVQGTLYPDVIESGCGIGPASIIKSHHNVGGLPKRMGLKLIEPLRYLFKDEVRKIARRLGLPDTIVSRKPFPGPGLAVRIIGPVTESRLETIRQADQILITEAKNYPVYERLWQIFPVLLPVSSVGVMGDKRCYGETIVIRAVKSEDGMTADWARLPYDLLEKVARRITNEIKGIVRVVYDLTSKPPATIEWE